MMRVDDTSLACVQHFSMGIASCLRWGALDSLPHPLQQRCQACGGCTCGRIIVPR